MSTQSSLMGIAVALAIGAASWTLLEFLLHNFLGHHGRGRNPFGKEHKRHHATTSYFAPTGKKALFASPVVLAAWAIFALTIGPVFGTAFAVGLVGMYIAYEVVHRRAHTHPPRGFYGRWLRRHHFHHHFLSPKTNHGVTTPIWDYVFGTRREVVGPVRVPVKHAMAWLVDPVTGRVRDEYAADYVLAGRGAAEPPPALEADRQEACAA